MCFNLRRQQYCIENKKYSKEEYERKIKELMPKTSLEYKATFNKFQETLKSQAIHKAAVITQCDNSTGDHLHNNKNARNSYYVFGSEDCSHCYDCGEIKNCVDAYEPFKGELQYETHGCNEGYNLVVCSKCYTETNASYSEYCWYCSNIFGCFGLRRKEYCIFNKQYTKAEYEELKAKIIAHMKKNNEWGDFFPSKLSPFGYNETAANDYYPLSEEDATAKGFNWKPENKKEYMAATKEILQCQTCRKNFRIIEQEMNFYKQNKLPIPDLCPDCRHGKRMSLRNPRKLWGRNCAKCNIEIQTTYAPDRPEMVYCEACYLKEVY
jgi:hypothetical protein